MFAVLIVHVVACLISTGGNGKSRLAKRLDEVGHMKTAFQLSEKTSLVSSGALVIALSGARNTFGQNCGQSCTFGRTDYLVPFEAL